MHLPKPLAPWHDLLKLFDQDLALEIGQMIQRLSSLIGPIRSRATQGQGEPDGYAGIINKGHWDRLLISEWLFADALPQEFDRRAAMNEQMYLQPRTRRYHHAPMTVALFDSGPEQLGKPRLVHLALLIVLAQRSQQAGGEFRWGISQHPEQGLYSGVMDEGQLLALLTARSAKIVESKHAADWHGRLAELDDIQECWIIGTAMELPANRRLQSRFHAVRIEQDSDQPEREKLNVILGNARRLALDLPPMAQCVRLLGNPFKSRQPNTAGLSIHSQSAFIFNRSGNYVLIQQDSDAMSLVSLKQYKLQSFSTVSPPKKYRLLAVGIRKRKIVMLLSSDQTLVISGGRHGKIRIGESFNLPSAKRVLYSVCDNYHCRYYFIDRCVLYGVQWQDAAKIHIIDTDIQSALAFDGYLEYYKLHHGKLDIRRVFSWNTADEFSVTSLKSLKTDAFVLGACSSDRYAMAYHAGHCHWQLSVLTNPHTPLSINAGSGRVIGITRLSGKTYVIVLQNSTIQLMDGKISLPFSLDHQPQQWAINPYEPEMIYTADSRLWLYHFSQQTAHELQSA